MNAYELAELRKRLEPKGLSVEWKPADYFWDPRTHLAFSPGTMVYEIDGPSGQAAMRRFTDGWYYNARSKIDRSIISGMGVDTLDESLASILPVIL